MHFGGGGATNEEWQVQSAGLHFTGHIDHFVEGGCDQAAEPDHVHAMLHSSVEDLLFWNHDAQIDDVIVVASEHHAHDVLADVVHVALDRGEENLAGLFALAFRRGFEVRCEPSHGLLHHACTLDDLREKHLAGTEKVSHDVHAVHQWAFDDLQWGTDFGEDFSDVGLDVLCGALHEGVFNAVPHRELAPGIVLLGLRAGLTLEPFSKVDETLCGVVPAVEQHVLHALEEVGGDVVIDGQHGRVDDAEVHAGSDAVEEEGAVHRFANHRVAPEAEADVGNATTDVRAR